MSQAIIDAALAARTKLGEAVGLLDALRELERTTSTPLHPTAGTPLPPMCVGPVSISQEAFDRWSAYVDQVTATPPLRTAPFP
jgi:hypothetical protein